MVATDGRRLAQVDGSTSGGGDTEQASAIVPVKTMTILERILVDPEEKVEIGFSGNQVVIRTAAVELSGNLVQGRFPNYGDVIPSGCEYQVELNIETFQSAVRRAALLSNENSRGIGVAFSAGKLQLTSSTPETGDAEINMEVDFEGEEMKLGFNPQYLLEMLRVVDEEKVVFEFTDSKKPGVLRSGKSFLYVIMPVQV
jgi:DNA polymerase-3 subunit beta